MRLNDFRGRARPIARGCLVLAVLTATLGAAAAEPLTITVPTDGETIHDNAGNLVVRVIGGPPAAGYQAYVDGAAAGPISLTPAFALRGIDRGEHQLSVDAVDGAGSTLDTAPAITFYLWQASRLFPGRQ